MASDVIIPGLGDGESPEEWIRKIVPVLREVAEASSNTGRLVETGSIVHFAGSILPKGYLPTDGSTFDQRTFPGLYRFLGSTTLPTKAALWSGTVVGIKT